MAGDGPSTPLEAAFVAACDDPARREKLDMSAKEQQSFLKAMKDPEFRSLLNEYMQEISDPTHRAEQEMYLRQLENDNKVPTDKQLVLPQPGFVLKTKYKQRKIFVNVCSSDKMQPPSSTRVASTPSTAGGTSWNLPYCVGPQRMEPDKGGQVVATYDVCYHPQTLVQAMQSAAFMKMLVNTALDGVDKVYENLDPEPSKVDRDYHVLKGVAYKSGSPVTMCLTTKKPANSPTPSPPKPSDQVKPARRASPAPAAATLSKPTAAPSPPPATSPPTKSSPLIQEISSTTTPPSTTPLPLPNIAYQITHRGQFDLADHMESREAKTFRPRDLVVKMTLPTHTSAAGIDLDVSATAVRVTAAGYAPLSFDLPFPVVEAKGKAKFDKATKTLVVTLPVVEPPTPSPPVVDARVQEVEPTKGPAVAQDVANPDESTKSADHKPDTATNATEHAAKDQKPIDHSRWVAKPAVEDDAFVAYREFAQMAQHDKPMIVYQQPASTIHETKTHMSHLVAVAHVDEATLSSVDEDAATLFRFRAGAAWFEYRMDHCRPDESIVDWTVEVASQNVAIVCRKAAPTLEPPFRVHRVSPAVISMLVHVAGVDQATVSSTFTAHGFALTFLGPDGDKFELARTFQDALDPDTCRVEVAQDNLLVVLGVTNPDGVYFDLAPESASDGVETTTNAHTTLDGPVASTDKAASMVENIPDEAPPQVFQVPRFSNDLMYELD